MRIILSVKVVDDENEQVVKCFTTSKFNADALNISGQGFTVEKFLRDELQEKLEKVASDLADRLPMEDIQWDGVWVANPSMPIPDFSF